MLCVRFSVVATSLRSPRRSGCTGRRCIGGLPGIWWKVCRSPGLVASAAFLSASGGDHGRGPGRGDAPGAFAVGCQADPDGAAAQAGPVGVGGAGGALGADHRADPGPPGPVPGAATDAASELSSQRSWERPGPMQLWGIDIVGGISIVNAVIGELREAKVVTGIDDHSRFCVMAKVVACATGRAVCLAFAQALAQHGVPEGVITDIQSGWRGVEPVLSARNRWPRFPRRIGPDFERCRHVARPCGKQRALHLPWGLDREPSQARRRKEDLDALARLGARPAGICEPAADD
jgi:hypothetical protein